MSLAELFLLLTLLPLPIVLDLHRLLAEALVVGRLGGSRVGGHRHDRSTRRRPDSRGSLPETSCSSSWSRCGPPQSHGRGGTWRGGSWQVGNGGLQRAPRP